MLGFANFTIYMSHKKIPYEFVGRLKVFIKYDSPETASCVRWSAKNYCLRLEEVDGGAVISDYSVVGLELFDQDNVEDVSV